MSASATCQINRVSTEPSKSSGVRISSDTSFETSLRDEQVKLEEKQKILAFLAFGGFEGLNILPLSFNYDFAAKSAEKIDAARFDPKSNKDGSQAAASASPVSDGHKGKEAAADDGIRVERAIDKNDFVNNIAAAARAAGDIRLPFDLSAARAAMPGKTDLEIVVAEIVDKIKLVKEGQKTTLSLSLKPDDAGEMLLSLDLKNGSVFISIIAGDSSRSWLESNISALEEALKKANVSIGGMTVSSGRKDNGGSDPGKEAAPGMVNASYGRTDVRAASPLDAVTNAVDAEKIIGYFQNNWIFTKA